MNQYVNPKICVHRDVVIYRRDHALFARCTVCDLEGPSIEIGCFYWWTVSKAARKFFKLANKIDREAT